MITDTLQALLDRKIIAIIRGVAAKDIVPVAQALVDGGISAMEITFDHTGSEGRRNTLDALARLKETFTERVSIGAGTVMTREDVRDARERGAEYIISPNVDEEVVNETLQQGLLSMPGAMTPTEAAAAWKMGCHIVKLFPAGLWGTEYLKAVRGPLAHIRMAAVGGVTPENIADFFRAGACSAGVGGNLVNAAKVGEGDFESVRTAARRFSEAVADI